LPPGTAAGSVSWVGAKQGAIMLQARVSLITLDPDELGDSVKFIEATICPQAQRQHGSLGVALYANAELGVVLL
jgi:hypothetical protein